MASYRTDAPESVYIPTSHHGTTTRENHQIREWLPWSIINLFLGWGVGGLLPLIFSLLCRSSKRNNDLKRAELMSTLALVFNVLTTISGIAGWICFIVLFVVVRRMYRYG